MSITPEQFAVTQGFNAEEIAMIRTFWDAAFNRSHIYLSDKIVKKYLVTSTKKDAVGDFIRRKLVVQYELGVDYIELKRTDPLVVEYAAKENVRFGSTKRFYAVTGETYKSMLMSSNTPRGRQARKYFIKVENLARAMMQYILQQEQKHAEELKKKVVFYKQQNEESHRFKKLYVDKESMYILSNLAYSKKHMFKIGKGDPHKRIASFNTGRSKQDSLVIVRHIKCHNASTLEKYLHRLLAAFRDDPRREWFKVTYVVLDNIVNMLLENEHNMCDLLSDLFKKVNMFGSSFEDTDFTIGIPENVLCDMRNLASARTDVQTSVQTDVIETRVIQRINIDISDIPDISALMLNGLTKEHVRQYVEESTLAILESDQIYWKNLKCQIVEKVKSGFGVKKIGSSREWYRVSKEILNNHGVLVKYRCPK